MNDIPELVRDIYQVFVDYFGEERVDIQLYNPANIIKLDLQGEQPNDYIILTHWDKVTVTNEYDESIDIWDLYSVTVVTPQGKMRRVPGFTRSTYDSVQWNSRYCHSHVTSLNQGDCARFIHSCLGSGPIKETINKLRTSMFRDLDVWRLYCWELDKYVHVESLSGGPYRRLREVGKNSMDSISDFKVEFNFEYHSSRICKIFTKHLVELLLNNNILKYNYVDGRYTIAMTYPEAIVTMSNAFIEWYNSRSDIYKTYKVESLFTHSFLEKAFIQGGTVIKKLNDGVHTPMNIGLVLFNFKGKPVTLQDVHSGKDYNAGEVIIVNTSILDYVIYIILRYLNLHYGESTDTTGQKTRVL